MKSGSAIAIICKYYDRSWIQNVAINKDDIKEMCRNKWNHERYKSYEIHVQYTSMWNNVAQGVWYKAAAQSTVELAEIVNTQNKKWRYYRTISTIMLFSRFADTAITS